MTIGIVSVIIGALSFLVTILNIFYEVKKKELVPQKMVVLLVICAFPIVLGIYLSVSDDPDPAGMITTTTTSELESEPASESGSKSKPKLGPESGPESELTLEPTTPRPTIPEPSTPLIVAPVGEYPTNYWEGDYVIGTLASVENSNPIQCALGGVIYTFSNEVGSFSLGHDSINIDNLLNLIGSECRFNIDTAGFVVDVEVEFDFDGILTYINYDENCDICGIQIDYYDGSGSIASTVPLELSKQLNNYLYVGNSYSVHFDIMGNISSIMSI